MGRREGEEGGIEEGGNRGREEMRTGNIRIRMKRKQKKAERRT